MSDFITVVSGLPRSGTSLLMQMLKAGGVPVLTDGVRAADPDNPRGYYEFEAVKSLAQDAHWLADALGHAVKVVAPLLRQLPREYAYRVCWMQRDLTELVRSQDRMLERRGEGQGAMSSARLREVYAAMLAEISAWLAAEPRFQVLPIDYAELVRNPSSQAERISDFLGGGLDSAAMARCVDPKLYRERA